MALKDKLCENMGLIYLVQDRDQWRQHLSG